MQVETESTIATTPDDSSAVPASLDRNDVFHLLQNSRRRGVVRYFTTTDEPVDIGDLADQIAAWECETTVDEITKDQRQRVYIALYQSHLSKLDDTDVIDYDERSGVVTSGPNHERLARHAAPTYDEHTATGAASPATESSGRSDASVWTGSYLGVSLGGMALVFTNLFGTVPGQVLSLDVLNLVLVATYLAVAFLHWSGVTDHLSA